MNRMTYNHNYYLAHKKHIIAKTKLRYRLKCRNRNFRNTRKQRSFKYDTDHRIQINQRRMQRYRIARVQRQQAKSKKAKQS